MQTAVSEALVARNPIKAALALTREVTPNQLERFVSEKEAANQALIGLRDLQSGLFGIEKNSAQLIKTKTAELSRKVRSLEAVTNPELQKYALFSLEPLTWRNKHGLPRLAVFSLESNLFELGVVGRRSGWESRLRFRQEAMKPKLPQEICLQYKDVFAKLMKTAKETKKSVYLRASFDGLIPTDVRNEIRGSANLFKNILIVAEVSKWDLKQVAVPKRVDPLVVGYDGINYRLIAAFDTTPLEEFIKSSFTAF